jgi:hypothetical protein
LKVRIRQIALVARELEPVVEDLRAVLGLAVGFRDPGVGQFGLENTVMPVGTQFLEVVAPVREGTTAGRYLERRNGDGGYMVILQTDNLGRERERLERLGVRVVWQIALDDIATIHLHPRDVGGAIVSFDQPEPPESWRWGGPDWAAQPQRQVVSAIIGVEIQSADPAALAARWAQVLGLAPAERSGDRFLLALEDGVLSFRAPLDERGDGISAIVFAARDRERALSAARARGILVEDEVMHVGGVRLILKR